MGEDCGDPFCHTTLKLDLKSNMAAISNREEFASSYPTAMHELRVFVQCCISLTKHHGICIQLRLGIPLTILH